MQCCALTVSGNITVNTSSLEPVLATYDAEEVSLLDLHSYDAVWAIAIAAAATAAGNPNRTKSPSGREVMQQIAKGGVPGFSGAAGYRKFLPNGDPDMQFAQMEITNYQVQKGASQGKQVVVGVVNFKDAGSIALSDVYRISWSNGEEYPNVSKLPFAS